MFHLIAEHSHFEENLIRVFRIKLIRAFGAAPSTQWSFTCLRLRGLNTLGIITIILELRWAIFMLTFLFQWHIAWESSQMMTLCKILTLNYLATVMMRGLERTWIHTYLSLIGISHISKVVEIVLLIGLRALSVIIWVTNGCRFSFFLLMWLLLSILFFLLPYP